MAKKKYKSIHKRNKRTQKATKANKKLITIIAVIGFVIVCAVGGMYYVNKKSPENNIGDGDSYLAEGNYRKAYKLYGRAVRKDAANLSYITKLREALIKIVPVTPDEARAYYKDYLGSLIHEARYNPNDIDAHLHIINELYKAAYLTGSDYYWAKLYASAKYGLERISPDNPRRYELLLYRGLSQLHIDDVSMTDTYDVGGNIRFPGEDDIEEVLESDPGNAIAWAVLAHGRMAIYHRVQSALKTAQIPKSRKYAEETMAKAMEVAGNSFEVLFTKFRFLILDRINLEKKRSNSQFVSQVDFDALETNIREFRSRLAAVYDPAIHDEITLEVVTLLQNSGEGGMELSVELLRKNLESDPDNYHNRLVYAILLGRSDAYDDAVDSLQYILDAPNETVGLKSLSLFEKRPPAALELVDLFIEQAMVTDLEDTETRDAFIAKATESKEVLSDLVSHNENNANLLYANGIIALAQKDFTTAATILEEVIGRNPDLPARVFRESAIALAETGSYGLARGRIIEALTKEPNNLSNYLIKAGIEIQLTNYEAAERTLSHVTETGQERPEIQAMLDTIALRTGNTKAVFTDPILQVVTVVQAEIENQNYAAAETILNESISNNPSDWRLFAAMSMTHNANENVEEAIIWLKKAIELEPDRPNLRRQLLALENEDIITAIIAFIESSEQSDAEKAETLAIFLYNFASVKLTDATRWSRMGNELEAIKVKELSDRAFVESEKYQGIAEDRGANLSDFLLIKINKALKNSNVDRARELLDELAEKTQNKLVVAGIEANLHLLQSTLAKRAGNQEVCDMHNLKELVIAEKMVKENRISDYAWRGLFGVHLKMGRNSEAMDASAKAYEISSKSKINIRNYLTILLLVGNKEQRILTVVKQAIKQYPNDKQFLEIWLEAENNFGDNRKVFGYREEQYLKNPDDRRNALELALFYINTEPVMEYLKNADGAQIISNRQWARTPEIQKRQMLQDARVEWDSRIKLIMSRIEQEKDPDIRTAILHATVYKDRGQLDESSSVLDTFIKSRIGTENFTGIVISAAEFLRKSERTTQSIALLESARELQGEKLEIDAVLGSMYHHLGGFELAANYLTPVVQLSGDSILQARLIESFAMSGQFDKAEEALVGYKTTNTQYAEAMLRAMISRVKSEQLLVQGDIDGGKLALVDYRNALQLAIGRDPSSQIPYIQLCKSLLNEYRLTQNKELLEEALHVADSGSELNKKSEQFEIVRSDVLQADGQLLRAITRMARFIADNPNASMVRKRLVEAYLDTNNNDKAIAVIKDGIKNDPTIPMWYQHLGDLHLRVKDDRSEAVTAYLSALRKNPSIRMLVQIDAITRTDQPIPDMELLRMAQGPMSKLHPIVKSIEAKALMNLGRSRDALIAMEQSWKLFQRSIENDWIPPSDMGSWYIDLAEMFAENPEEGEGMLRRLAGTDLTSEQMVGLAAYYRSVGDDYMDKALGIIDAAIANPSTTANTRTQLFMMRGGYLVELGRFAESEQAFRTLINEQSSPLVMNNLAYVIGVYMDEPARGLELAKKAAKLAPRIPAIIDTVATLYERVGDIQKAAETLDFLIQVDPSNSAALSRLSLLYSEALHEPERAIVFAERARSLSARSPEVLDALGWCYYKTGRKAIGEQFLQRSLKYGETLSAYLHMAQVVMQRREYEEALGHLRMAQELAEDSFSLKRVTSLQDDIRNIQASVPE